MIDPNTDAGFVQIEGNIILDGFNLSSVTHGIQIQASSTVNTTESVEHISITDNIIDGNAGIVDLIDINVAGWVDTLYIKNLTISNNPRLAIANGGTSNGIVIGVAKIDNLRVANNYIKSRKVFTNTTGGMVKNLFFTDNVCELSGTDIGNNFLSDESYTSLVKHTGNTYLGFVSDSADVVITADSIYYGMDINTVYTLTDTDTTFTINWTGE